MIGRNKESSFTTEYKNYFNSPTNDNDYYLDDIINIKDNKTLCEECGVDIKPSKTFIKREFCFDENGRCVCKNCTESVSLVGDLVVFSNKDKVNNYLVRNNQSLIVCKLCNKCCYYIVKRVSNFDDTNGFYCISCYVLFCNERLHIL